MKPNKPADIRTEYYKKTLLEPDVAHDPIEQFSRWWKDVMDANIEEANAMVLATSSIEAVPSARIVLLKDFSHEGFVFFTNYNSFKGKQLAENPKACLLFFWKELERQVRITGLVSKVSEEESDTYFNSRPEDSRIGAIASPQSEVIANREWIDEKFNQLQKDLQNKEIKRPGHWGGYIVNPVMVEFWQGRPSRLHDRIQYSLSENGSWKIERLAP
jgi:pyridoxamine 5'-phosphate oxidase